MYNEYLKEQFALAIDFRRYGTGSQRNLGKVVVEGNRSEVLGLMKVV